MVTWLLSIAVVVVLLGMAVVGYIGISWIVNRSKSMLTAIVYGMLWTLAVLAIGGVILIWLNGVA